ncbi:hypothetical protein [Endozoicomonas sp.]|uniref:hypothetical protein n=1 Tax=Endozoicomonas sp. TaxID=1892382 RepID=UPI002887188B|nr:hypothetical protein [Endozoicomonas sp.]
MDEDGDLDESALMEAASWQANNAVEDTSQRKLVTDHVSYERVWDTHKFNHMKCIGISMGVQFFR